MPLRTYVSLTAEDHQDFWKLVNRLSRDHFTEYAHKTKTYVYQLSLISQLSAGIEQTNLCRQTTQRWNNQWQRTEPKQRKLPGMKGEFFIIWRVVVHILAKTFLQVIFH